MLESVYQGKVIRRLKREFDGCLVLKNDSGYIQGIPDLTILYRNYWAMLEVKLHWNSPVQPNQQYYVDLANGMSFAAFIYPGNEDEVFVDLQHTFQPGWETRLS